jgi:hypothetical protein
VLVKEVFWEIADPYFWATFWAFFPQHHQVTLFEFLIMASIVVSKTNQCFANGNGKLGLGSQRFKSE